MKKIETEEELDQFIADSDETQVFFYKHSTACPVSYRAMQEVEAFEKENSGVIIALIDVIQNRSISNALALHSHVKHESPEIILYENQKPVYSSSHSKIRKEELQKQYKPYFNE